MKTKSFTQYIGDSFRIRVFININGTFKNSNSIHVYGDAARKKKKEYRKKNIDKILAYNRSRNKNIKGFTQYTEPGVNISLHIRGDGTIKDRSYTRFMGEEHNKRSVRYYSTPTGKESRKKTTAIRKGFGFKPINNIFPDSHGHHLNYEDVIYIPSSLHKSISHSVSRDRNMKEINDTAFEWLCTQESL